MKKVLSVIMLFTCITATAQEFTYTHEGQTLNYTVLDSEAKTCGVSGNNDVSGDLVIPSTVSYEEDTYKVTSIGNNAFYACGGLTSVDIPNSVISIGIRAFYHCDNLTKVNIHDIEAWCNIDWEWGPFSTEHSLYLNGTEIKDLVIPNSVTDIGDYAFNYCSSLTSVDIPNSVKSIGEYAFSDCNSLTLVDIPNSVTSIGKYAFTWCYNLTKINIHDIEAWCNIDIDGVSFWDLPFSCCHSLYLNGTEIKDLVIPNSVTTIGKGAFSYCSLTSVDIPNSVTTIGEEAFVECENLTKINIHDIEAWCNINFEGHILSPPFSYCYRLYLNGTEIKDLVIPNSVTNIGDYTFLLCKSLVSVNIPNSVTSIGDGAFYGCENLTKINIHDIEAWCNIQFGEIPFSTEHSLYLEGTEIKDLVIPNSVTNIGNWAFVGCSSLTSVDIPNSVTSIGKGAFYGCSDLRNICSLNTTPPSAYEDSFDDVHYENATLFVPQEAMKAYWTADVWRNFLNIQEATNTGIESIKADGNSQEDMFYDISGRKLDRARNGLNIINGKKVIIK